MHFVREVHGTLTKLKNVLVNCHKISFTAPKSNDSPLAAHHWCMLRTYTSLVHKVATLQNKLETDQLAALGRWPE